MKYRVTDKYKGARVCLPDEVIDLRPGVSQRKLRKLFSINFPGVEIAPDEPTEVEAEQQQGAEGE